VISLVTLWGGAKDGMVSNSVFRPLAQPILGSRISLTSKKEQSVKSLATS